MKRFTILLLVAMLVVAAVGIVQARKITPTGCGQDDLVTFLGNVVTQHNLMRDYTQTMCFGNVNVASHGYQVKVGQAAANLAPYSIAGRVYSVASAVVTMAGTAQSTLTNRFYLISINSDGTATCTAGTAVASGSTPTMHAPPSGYCPIAGVYVTASGTFTPGTSTFGGVLTQPLTFVNLSYVDLGTDLSLDSF
jgi:hypothetical protein